MNNVLETKLSAFKAGKSPLHQSDFLPSSIPQRAIKGLIVFRGDVADRPSDGSTEVQVYYAEDESKLYIWNTTSEAWESSTFS